MVHTYLDSDSELCKILDVAPRDNTKRLHAVNCCYEELHLR